MNINGSHVGNYVWQNNVYALPLTHPTKWNKNISTIPKKKEIIFYFGPPSFIHVITDS